MTMIEDYLREVQTSLRVDATRKRQIIDELRTHLSERVDDIQAAEPERRRADIEQEVVRDFGNPRDLALAYNPEGTPVLTNSAGDIVLRLGQAVGRGAVVVGRKTGTVLKWTAVALAVLLVTSLGVGAWAYYEVKPYIPAIIEQSEPSYQYSERCAATPCNGEIPADSFYVRADAKTVKFDLGVFATHEDGDRSAHIGNGSVRVVVSDSAGLARLDRTFNMSSDSRMFQQTNWAALEGNWTVNYTFTQFVGEIDMQTRVILFPFPE